MTKIVKLNVSLALVNFILSNNTNTTAKPTAHDLSAWQGYEYTWVHNYTIYNNLSNNQNGGVFFFF